MPSYNVLPISDFEISYCNEFNGKDGTGVEEYVIEITWGGGPLNNVFWTFASTGPVSDLRLIPTHAFIMPYYICVEAQDRTREVKSKYKFFFSPTPNWELAKWMMMTKVIFSLRF